MVGIMRDTEADGRVPDNFFFEHALPAETFKQI